MAGQSVGFWADGMQLGCCLEQKVCVGWVHVAHHGGGYGVVVSGGRLEALCCGSGLTLKCLYLFLCVAPLSVLPSFGTDGAECVPRQLLPRIVCCTAAYPFFSSVPQLLGYLLLFGSYRLCLRVQRSQPEFAAQAIR